MIKKNDMLKSYSAKEKIVPVEKKYRVTVSYVRFLFEYEKNRQKGKC